MILSFFPEFCYQCTKERTRRVLELTIVCNRCEGTGNLTKDLRGNLLPQSEHGVCYYCNGKGKLLTASGRELLEFLKLFGPDALREGRPNKSSRTYGK